MSYADLSVLAKPRGRVENSVTAGFANQRPHSPKARFSRDVRQRIRRNLVRSGVNTLETAVMQGLHVVARAETDPRRLTDAVDAALAPLTAK
ncbi:hypothetical protein ACFORH_35895 [Amycolatopsis roodepoortensis]|uniref:Uncharacterized protein n=1 Tax=Amycolatopsis roodepoortensis TaxID=700274 RepID=A0ABR9LGP3_9PSEU|nr:hypothetical protein [Amycolatopsis roodepoortensis]MBE1579824.1 hypothetical protein [Amycolatopsis roodepoortensis]